MKPIRPALGLLAGLLLFAMGTGCSDDDDPPPPAPPFGPSLCAVGDAGTVLLSPDAFSWSKVTVPSGLAVLDLVKVVRVPGHASRRLVTFGREPSSTENGEIWISDDGGATWTEAGITVNTAAGVHTASGWTLTDLCFVNALDGYALGNDDLVLRTVDAGATWNEMNTWFDGSNPTDDVELDLTYAGTAYPVQGDTLSQDQGGSVIVTGDVVVYDDTNDLVVLTNVAGGTFNSTDTVTWSGGAESAAVFNVNDSDVWRYPVANGCCIFAVEHSGAGTSKAHSIWIANAVSDAYEGVWKIESTAADPGASRTFTWTPPTVAFQQSATASDVSYDTIHRFFFFDENTGVAARGTYGILQTEDGGATWTFDTTTDLSGGGISDEWWSECWYVDNGGAGWLYSIQNDGAVIRAAMVYSGAGSPPYRFDSSGTTWEVLLPSGTSNDATNDEHTGVVFIGGRVFAVQIDSAGYWTYSASVGSAVFDNDVFSDPWSPYLGGNPALGTNPIEDRYIEDGGGMSYGLNHWCRR